MQIKTVLISICILIPAQILAQDDDPHQPTADGLFQTSSQCIACHSGLKSTNGMDVSIGTTWRASMMANSARDPYWHAGVRREVMDHPEAQAAIEDKCSTCHMPMAHVVAAANDGLSEVFTNIASMRLEPEGHLAADGVSCAVCHQIAPENFGTEESFDGGFLIDTTTPTEQRRIFGPHDVDAGRQRIMQSASGFSPETSAHLAESELCATCHTLFTSALDDQGREAGTLAEQVPYLEWLESDFSVTASCQDCHMPVLTEDAPISSVLGQPRPDFSQHVFRGGNSFMLTILAKYRGELGVTALPQELDATIRRTRQYLQTETAALAIEEVDQRGDTLSFTVAVRNLAGHKLPTAYPSRRVWLRVSVTDAGGNTMFESGALRADGSIVGNDNDANPLRYEPHYDLITSADQVQIYEPVLVDSSGQLTTGLISAVDYIKDNRLLPAGFDKAQVDEDVAVSGSAEEDPDFTEGGDRVRYRLAVESRSEITIRAELLYQSIGFRWAENLAEYSAPETDRFLGYYRETIDGAAVTLASDFVSQD
jgi:hypothetical protein